MLKTDRVFVSMMHAATGASLLSPNACIRVLLRVCEACLACATKPFQLDDASVRAMFIGVSTLLQAHQHHAGPAAMWSPVHTQALHLILTLTCLYESCAALHVWRGTAGIAATALMWYAVTNQWQQPWRPVSAIATLLHNMSGSTKIWPVCVDAFPIEALSDMMLSSVRGSPAARALSDRLKTASYYLTEAIEAAVTVAVDGCAILCVPPASLRVDWILEYVRSHVNVPAAVLLKLMKQQLSCQSLVLQPAVITALRESFQIKSVFDAITASSRLPTSIISDAIVGYLKRETMTARQKDGDRFQRHCHELVPTLQWLLSQFQTRDGSHFAHAVLQAVFEPVSSSLAAMPVSFASILISLLTDGKPALLSFMNTCVQCLPPGNTATGCPAATGTTWVAGMCLSLYLCGISSDSIVELLNTVLQHAPILLSSLHLPSDSPLLCDIFVAAGCWSLSVSGQGQSPQITTTFPCSILNAFELCIATSELHCCVLLTSAPCASLLLSALRLAREMVATPPSAAAVSLSFIQRCGVFIAELTSMYVAAGFTGAGTQVQSDDAILIDVVFPTPALNVPATSDHSLLGSTVGELPLVSLYKQREAGRISSSHAKQALIDVSVLFPADIETIPFQSAMLKSLLWALSSITDESFDVWPIVSVIFRFGSPFSVDTLTDMHAQLRTLPPLVRNQLHCSGCDLWPPHRTITSLLMCTAAFIDDITLFSLTHLDWIIAVISNCDWSTDSALWISLHRSCIAPLLRALCEESATICIRDLITHLNTAMSTHLGHTNHFASMLSACYMLNPDSVYDAACAGALGWSWSACDDVIMFLQRQCTSDITLLAEKHMLQSPTTRLMRLRQVLAAASTSIAKLTISNISCVCLQTVCNIGNTARACVAAARHPYIAIFCTQPIAARLLLALDEQRSIFSNDSPPVHLLLALISDTAVLHAMMHLVRVLASALEVLEHTSLARLPAMAHVEIARSLAPLHQIVQLIGVRVSFGNYF